jgi:adenylate cyclase
MRGRPFRSRLMLAAGCGLVGMIWTGIIAQAHLAGRASLLDRIESPFLDLRFLVAGPRQAPANLAIVALDDDTVADAGGFPLPRTKVAELVRKLTELGATAIGLDILFIDPGVPESDKALAEALRGTKAVLAAAGLFRDAADGTPAGLPAADRVIWPIGALLEVAAPGLVNITTDHGGTPRHVPLLLRSGDSLLTSFPLRVAAHAAGAEASLEGERITIGSATTRADLGLNLPLRFYGPSGTIRTISARVVLRGDVEREAVAGSVVVVGATALGTSDTFTTPFDPVFPGVEVLATAVGHLMTGDGLVRDRTVRRWDVAAGLTLALAAVLLISILPLGLSLALTGLAAAGWLAFTALAFGEGYWFSAVVPLTILSLPMLLCAAGRQALDRRQARRLASAEGALRLFQSPVLAERIADDPAFLARPVEQDAPILFIDLSNFTRLSERLGPQRSREFLRGFHGVVEDEVTRHGGLVLDFMGDGAMIAFGLPEARADDAARAVRAALGLASRVAEWLAERSRDLPEVRPAVGVRVGAHYGPVVVSRLGTETHQHITTTGDSVNVASRLLEVASREGAVVVASADLLRAAGEVPNAAFGDLRSVDIRGRAQPLTVALRRTPARPSPAHEPDEGATQTARPPDTQGGL